MLYHVCFLLAIAANLPFIILTARGEQMRISWGIGRVWLRHAEICTGQGQHLRLGWGGLGWGGLVAL